ncbi:hybrid sensor histidine kinase/response regulator [Oligoflexus tunisiensis]|uniref:hybrid sensor histidine kinase/response regulator n=1 Tax=Oligoflexus tunisiensis TaxID=708132 RepID=UPI000ABCC841|nr:ATP-binding protein [Oligoflexus tunisiensis]
MTPEIFLSVARFATLPMLLVDGDGRILAVNSACSVELGLTNQEIVGTHLWQIISAPKADVCAFLKSASRSSDLYPARFPLKESQNSDAADFIFEGALVAFSESISARRILVRFQSKRELRRGFIALNQKIDELTAEMGRCRLLEEERTKLLQAEQKARRDAEYASRAKDEFLAVVSHELRTPMGVIKGWVDLLRQGDVDPSEYHEVFKILSRNAEMQVQLISDLLDVSRIITGKLSLDIKPVTFSSVIERTVESLRFATEAKQVKIFVSINPATGPISGDIDRLQQVVWNLLMNAIKFSEKGGKIFCSLDRKGSRVEFTVEDQGVGIESSFLPHVFERFIQEDGSHTRKHGGLGLGLAIVRHIVELHGGTVSAASKGKGHGATFNVSFPLLAVNIGTKISEETSDADTTQQSGPAPGKSTTRRREELVGIRVVVVDDEKDTRELIAQVLRRFGAEVMLASNVREALDRLADGPIDVLISDIGMPFESGYDLIRIVKERDQLNGTKTRAAALTAFATSADRAQALALGFEEHLSKPVEPHMLVKTIAHLAGR